MLTRQAANVNQTRLQQLQRYLAHHYIHSPSTSTLCDTWAQLVWEAKQQGRVLSGSGAWIAATAIVLGVPLVSHNAKDFQFL